MFHRYVVHEGAPMDIDRAVWMMDKRVLENATRILPPESEKGVNDTGISAANLQRLWNEYCRLHLDRYGEPFNPDVT
jgi:hypothetical protein